MDRDESNTRAKTGAGWAAAALLVLVIAGGWKVFDEGWTFAFWPHNYLFTSLELFHDRAPETRSGDDLFFSGNQNNLRSPLYAIANTFGAIGEPAPPWFRLTGIAIFILVFVTAYLLRAPPAEPVDRLLTALFVATTPVAIVQARALDNHLFHIWVVLSGAACLARSGTGRKRWMWFFFLLPAVDLYVTLMLSHFVLAGLCLFGMYAFGAGRRVRHEGAGAVARRDGAPLIAGLIVLGIVAVSRLTWGDIEVAFDYYRVQSGVVSPGDDLAWWRALTAYPLVLVLSAAGVIPSLFALFQLSRKLRESNAGIWLSWIAVPLVVLTIVTKKESQYIWYAAPAVALLAAGTATRFPAKVKTALAIALVGLGLFHTFAERSPVESLLGGQPVMYVGPLIGDQPRWDPAAVRTDASEILAHAQECGGPDNRELLIAAPGVDAPETIGLAFALLSLDQRPRYRLLDDPDANLSPGAVVVQPAGLPRSKRDTAFVLNEAWDRIVSNSVRVHESPDLRVYCYRPQTDPGHKRENAL